MTVSETDLLEDRAKLLEALASPVRLKILKIIASQKGVTNEDLVAVTDKSQPNISFHHKKLGRAGIVDRSKEGRNKVHRLNRGFLESRGIDLEKFLKPRVDELEPTPKWT